MNPRMSCGTTKPFALYRLIILTLAVGFLGGCESSPTESGPLAEPQYSTQVGDSTYWDSNGLMEFADSTGTVWRYQRYGSDTQPYRVDIWKDGVFQGDVSLSWSGGEVIRYRFRNADWAETDDSGDEILDTSVGVPPSDGGGGGDDDGGDVLIDLGNGIEGVTIEPAPQDSEWLAYYSSGPNWGDCPSTSVRGYASAAIAGSAMTGALAITQLVTKLPFHHVTRRAAAGTAGAIVATIGATLDWIDCLI